MKKEALLLLMPALLLSGVVFLLPFIWLLLLTFKERVPGSLNLQSGFSLANYRSLFADLFFARVMLDTLVMSGFVTVLCLMIALPVSRFIVRFAGKMRGLLLALTLIPLISGALLPALGMVNLLGPLGIVNGVLKEIGVISSSLRFLGTKMGIMIGLIQAFLPLMILPLVTIMSRIPHNFESAAASLGASPLVVFRRIILPLSAPGVVAGSVLVFCACLTSFVTPQILGQGKVATFGMIVYQQAALVLDWPFAATLAVFMLVVLAFFLSIFLLLQHIFWKNGRMA